MQFNRRAGAARQRARKQHEHGVEAAVQRALVDRAQRAVRQAGEQALDKHQLASCPFEAVVHRNRKFADSLLEGAGFELVWGFFCQVVVLGLLSVFCSERERPFFVPSPAIRFPERAEGVKGPKR